MSLEELIQQRTIAKRNISRIKTLIDANSRGESKPLSREELKCRLGILDSYFKQIIAYQTQIEKLDANDLSRGEIEDQYVSIKIAIQTQLGEDANATFVEASSLSVSHQAKLPILKLPTFSGRYSEYVNFITSFKQIIDREVGLSNIEKFNHLLNCLQGQALDTVKAFQVNNENYPKAIDRLKSRYDNSTLIFMENISSLFELPSVQKQSSNQLRHLVDTASALFGALSSLGSDKNIAEAMLIHLVIEKADEGTRKKWKESLEFERLPTWQDCSKIIERRCQFFESIDTKITPQAHHSKLDNKPARNSYGSQRRSFALSYSNRACSICSCAGHVIKDCPRYVSMDVNTRYAKVKELRLCTNCLSSNHFVSKCTSPYKCRHCTVRHHSSLCQKQSSSSSNVASAPLNSICENSAIVHTHLEKSSIEHILLATAVVLVRDSSGQYQVGKALLDSCSQVNFITEEFAQRLRLPKTKQSVEILSIGRTHTNIKHKASTTIKSRCNELELPLTFCVTTHISHQPESQIDISSWNVPANLELADEGFYKSQRIDLLLGTESFFDILSVGQIKLGKNLPILQKTLLGWIVSGRCNSSSSKGTSLVSVMSSQDEAINHGLERMWKIDDVSSIPNAWTADQSKCESFFDSTVARNKTGRLIVKLPFKSNPSCLGSSYSTAFRRFISLEHRLDKQPETRTQYVAFMQEYEALGHMTEVKNINLSQAHYFIPHQCVLRPTSTTTKLRVVFDASCRTSTQTSLNDILLVGPTIQTDLFLLLVRFRLNLFALTADIVKMYRQVLVDPDDRRFQLILWRSSKHEEVRTYQLNTITYGTAAAPFLAVRSLQYLADQHASSFQLGAATIKSSFYVDDLLCGANSLLELKQIKHEVSKILEEGGLQLSKWHSNHDSVMNEISTKNLTFDNEDITSTLGLAWDQKNDTFHFSFRPKFHHDGKVTKRTILSLASSLFDPLGLIAPIIIVAKIILQELWLLKLQWDESVPQKLYTAWNNLLKNFTSLTSIAVPRYCLSSEPQSIQIHGFCDSSIRAYGCCVYLRSMDSFNNIKVQLLTAKSRVAPTKKKSLPKLELCGAHLLAMLFQKLKNSLSKYNADIFLWSDSQVVLHWLKMHSATLSAFVGNRVSEIQEITENCQWRHVSSQQNPADVVSRGCTVQELQESIWFHGPSFLSLQPDQWPKEKCTKVDLAEVEKEKRKSAFHSVIRPNYILEIIEKFSSHVKLLRVVAWMFRFYFNAKKCTAEATDASELTPQELHNALWCIVYIVQQDQFVDDISRLTKGIDCQGSLKYLNPFLQENGGFNLLKVGGRLKHADIADGQKHPVLLPAKSSFVENFVRHLHRSNYHAGPKALVALIRQNFWIVNGRNIARRIVHSCIHCVRYRPKLLQQIMGNIPSERLIPSRPFARTAVDFCGPISTYLRIRGKIPYKTYVAIFVCLSSKAVHIEAVSDLSSDAFIAALKRLIGRRGLPTDIFCDNATNFVGANSKMAELKAFFFNSKNQNDIVRYCTNEFINFRFIPPRAPHFGGLWEAAVKAAKGHLNRTLINARMTFEELATVLVEIEAILNSRPLSALSSDPSDFQALTPAHLIIGSSLKAMPERSETYNEISQLERWRRITAAKERFWQRWSHDYLNELQLRTKWTGSSKNVENGCLVLVHEDNLPPQRWIMGRIINCIPGKDEKVRVVDVKTPKGLLRRPIQKLALLPA